MNTTTTTLLRGAAALCLMTAALSSHAQTPTAPQAQATALADRPEATSKTAQSSRRPIIWYSDERLKQDISLLDRLPSGLGLYAYRYVWSDTVYVGVMAQEVAAVMPDAVTTAANGFLQVDYQRLGMELVTLQQWVAAQRH